MDGLTNVLSTGSGMSLRRILLNLCVSFLFGLMIAALYRRTHRSLSFGRSFPLSLILLSVIVCSAMMVIGNSLARAFGMVGALSLIRFRTILKDIRDITYVFFSLVVGMACGIGNYPVALASTVAIGLFILILDKMHFGAASPNEFLLKLQLSGGNGQNQEVQALFEHYLNNSKFLGLHVLGSGKGTEITHSVQFKNKKEMDEFVQRLRSIGGVDRVGMISAVHEIEP